jgi:hypothetical protein
MVRWTGSLLVLVATMVAAPNTADAQPRADSVGIRAAAADYIQGWYEGDTTRMRRALHPDLAKRIVETSPAGKSTLDHMGAAELVEGVARGGGRRTPKDQQRGDIRILDIFGNAASVRVDAASWVDYLHIAKYDGRWVIVNVLWELRPRPA